MDLSQPAPGDFAGYWTLGRLLVDGSANYGMETVLALQQSIGWRDSYPNLVWYAPWALPIFALFGVPPFSIAWPLWLMFQMALLFAANDRLWLLHGGKPAQRWIPLLITVAFYPTLALAIWRQASAIPLVGLVSFLALSRRRRDVAAGMCLALAAIKPQLFYLVWLALAVWIWRSRRWRIAVGIAAVCVAGSLIAAVTNPPFVVDYLRHLASRPPEQQVVPTLGGALRLLFGAEHFWLQFVPGLVGGAWLALWFRGPRAADFEERLPQLVLASFVFGVFFWTPDLVALSVCTIPAAVALVTTGDRRARLRYGAVFFAITVVAAVVHEYVGDHWFYWLPVAYAVLLWRVGCTVTAKRIAARMPAS